MSLIFLRPHRFLQQPNDDVTVNSSPSRPFLHGAHESYAMNQELSKSCIIPPFFIYLTQCPLLITGPAAPETQRFRVILIFAELKVGTNENGSACGRWLSIGI